MDEEKYNEIMSTWLEFRKIILEKDMTPERYNGSDEMLTGDKCKCSLRKFLEWESTKGFFWRTWANGFWQIMFIPNN